MSTPEPGAFVDDWLTAWNRHDVDAVLTHFHDDVVFTSPIAARVIADSKGVVRGKAALREYWRAALETATRAVVWSTRCWNSTADSCVAGTGRICLAASLTGSTR